MSSPIRKFSVHMVVLWDPEPDRPTDVGPIDYVCLGYGRVEGESPNTAIWGTPGLVGTIAGAIRRVVASVGQVHPRPSVDSETILIALPELGLFRETPLD